MSLEKHQSSGGSHDSAAVGARSQQTAGSAESDNSSLESDEDGRSDDVDAENHAIQAVSSDSAAESDHSDSEPELPWEDSQPNDVVLGRRRVQAPTSPAAKSTQTGGTPPRLPRANQMQKKQPRGKENRPPRKGAKAAGQCNGKNASLLDEEEDDLPEFVAAAKDSAVTTYEDRLADVKTTSELQTLRESFVHKRVWTGTVQINVNWCKEPGELCTAARAKKLDMHRVEALMKKMKHCTWVAGALPMVVMLRPYQRKSQESFSMNDFDVGKYTCFVLGGNHSWQARSRLTAKYPGVPEYQWMEATVLAGLTEAEMRVVTTDHNSIAEARKNFSFIDRVKYMRHEIEQ